MDTTFIPRRLNDGWKIAWFDLDVALPFVAIFFLGLLVGQKLAALVLGLLVSRSVMRIKADKHPAFFLHWVYWHLPAWCTPLKRTPPSYLRRMIG